MFYGDGYGDYPYCGEPCIIYMLNIYYATWYYIYDAPKHNGD